MNSNARKRLLHVITSLIVFMFMVGGSASAQWVNIRLAGTPRTPDGKPNLTAPAPRAADGKPDLSGLWHNLDVKYLNDLSADGIQVPFTPQGAAIYKERQDKNAKGRPSESGKATHLLWRPADSAIGVGWTTQAIPIAMR